MPVDLHQYRKDIGRIYDTGASNTRHRDQPLCLALSRDITEFNAQMALATNNPPSARASRTGGMSSVAHPGPGLAGLQFMVLLSMVCPASTLKNAEADDSYETGVARFGRRLEFDAPQQVSIPPVQVRSPVLSAITGVMADRVPLPQGAVGYDKQAEIAFIDGSQQKANLIQTLKTAWIAKGLLSPEQGERFEFALRMSSADHPMMLAALQPSQQRPNRRKRASEKTIDAGIRQHIEKHCAFEEEVRNVEGENEGKLLIFEAQRIENPFRGLFSGDAPNPSPEMRGVEEGVNGALDILTLGIKPLVAKIVANAKRSQYYRQKGDAICESRYQRWSLAEVATALDVDGLALMRRRPHRPASVKPSELQHALPAPARAAYFTSATGSGVQREILLELKHGKSDGALSGLPIYLKPTNKKNEYLAYQPDAIGRDRFERRVIVDDDRLTWRYADTFDAPGLEVEIKEGKRQIALYGDYYELQLNAEKGFEVVVPKEGGVREYVPVYNEPLSRTWHLAVRDGVEVFTPEQRAFLDKISIEPNPTLIYIPGPTNNPKAYGAGIVFETEVQGDESHYTRGRVIEMGGHLVPVRTCTTPGHGMHFEVYDPSTPASKGRPVAFDGMRWFLEPSTSPAVSPALTRVLASKKLAYPERPAPDSSKLSAPDVDGLQWDDKDRSFLKVDNAYLRITKQNDNRYVISRHGEQRVHLRLRDGRFHVETARERLKNILTVGLNGRTRARAEDVLMECGYTLEDSSALLSGYAFPAQGFYTAYEFALHIESWEALPHWAERFKITPQTGSAGADVPAASKKAELPSFVQADPVANANSRAQAPERHASREVSMEVDDAVAGPSRRRSESTDDMDDTGSDFGSDGAMSVSDGSSDSAIVVKDPLDPRHLGFLHLGEMRGQGYWGTVYDDAEDANFVIKRYFQFKDDGEATDEIYTARCEAETFRRLYGDDAARHYVERDGTEYVRMYRIPGVPLEDLPENTLPNDAIERYVDVLEKLQRIGIMHNDLHPENVLWDGETFWPIDMQDISARYFAENEEGKEDYNGNGERIWEEVVQKIGEKMKPTPAP